MLRSFMSIAALVFLATFAAAVCWAAELDEVVAALQAPFQAGTTDSRRIRDYTADFSQQSKITSLNRVQQAHGKIVVQFGEVQPEAVPNIRFRWEYLQPTIQEIVSDGDRIWVYLPENNQVIVTDTDQAAGTGENNPMVFLTGLGNLARDFRIGWGEPARDPDGDYVLALQPRQVSALLARLLIVVNHAVVDTLGQDAAGRADEGVFPIKSVTVVDANGNTSLISFHNVRINLNPDGSLFRFEIPAGVDVVRPESVGPGF